MPKIKETEAKIPVFVFEEGDKVVVYSPAFDLSSCGDNEEQARRRFAEAIGIFLREIAEMGTLDEVLEECGWRKLPKKWCPPIYKTIEEEISIPLGG